MIRIISLCFNFIKMCDLVLSFRTSTYLKMIFLIIWTSKPKDTFLFNFLQWLVYTTYIDVNHEYFPKTSIYLKSIYYEKIVINKSLHRYFANTCKIKWIFQLLYNIIFYKIFQLKQIIQEYEEFNNLNNFPFNFRNISFFIF